MGPSLVGGFAPCVLKKGEKFRNGLSEPLVGNCALLLLLPFATSEEGFLASVALLPKFAKLSKLPNFPKSWKSLALIGFVLLFFSTTGLLLLLWPEYVFGWTLFWFVEWSNLSKPWSKL